MFAPFLIKSSNEDWRLIVFAPFLIKSPNEIWRLIVFAPFLIIITSVNTEMCCSKGKCGCQYFILLTLKKKFMDTSLKRKIKIVET